jgi:geranylgeranyl diphosphate synthase type I
MKEIPNLYPNVSGFGTEFVTGDKLDAQEYLDWFKLEFDQQLFTFLEQKKKEAEEINTEAAELVEEIIRFSKNGGRRVRPAFMYSGYVASGGRAHDAILYTTLAVELLHVFALIHDDIIDNSDLRRGEPTAHKAFEKLHSKKKLKGSRFDYGLSTAILAGDLALSFAEEIMTSAPFPQERVRRARYFFDQMKSQVIYGEYLDVLGSYKKSLTEDEVLQVLDYKTAKYTVERPLHIGAMLAGADYKVLETFTAYAIPFGQAFQIQDDLVGTFGSKEAIGKPNDSDIKEGKKTLLLAKALENSNKKQRSFINKVVGYKKASEEDVERVRRIMKQTGAYDYCVKLSLKLLEQARNALENTKLPKDGVDYLLAATEYLEKRFN